MGQDTRCNIGVTYRCEYSPKNRKLIEKLLKMEEISVFITADNNDSDEVLEITDALVADEDMFNNEVIAKAAHDWYGYKNLVVIDKEVIFKRDVYQAHARNISRRGNGNALYDECYTASGMIATLQKVLAEFKAVGIKEKHLSIGHTMTDD
jgi:hypothetical protein